jgi:hypothetical protein
MAKTKISEFDVDPANNTDINSINIAEGCAPSGINNAIRQLMSDLKEFQTGGGGDPFNGAVNGTVGATTPSTGAFTTLSASGVTTVSAGTVSAPAITTTGDTNTGIFFPAADTIAFAEGGAEAMRLDASGNLGLGVTPSASWWTSTKSIGIGRLGNGIFGATGDDEINIGANVINTGSGTYIYGATDTASLYRQVAGQHVWSYAASGTAGAGITFTEAMRINSSGNVGIGTSSPSSDARLTISNGGEGDVALMFARTGGTQGEAAIVNSLGNLIFKNGADSATVAGLFERMRIDDGGRLLVGMTTAVVTNTGLYMSPLGFMSIGRTSDATLMQFASGGTVEGSISVSGTTVSYNGGHLARYAQTLTAKDESILKGTVLSNLDEMNEYTKPTTYWVEEDELPEGVIVGDVKEESSVAENEQLNKVKVSDVEGDANVAGVFVNWYFDEQHKVDEINMAMTGDMIIRIAEGVTVQRGDLLMSAGDGTAKPQGDDIVRSKTIAKVTSTNITCTYADGSYCVPCVLMAC